MLETLTIQNIIIIDRLDLTFDQGFSVLTGETGAGKSILLNALGFALGERPPAKFIREGYDQAEVIATFGPEDLKEPLKTLLTEMDISYGEGLILRRTLQSSGRGKSFLNQIPVSVETLKTVGSHLVDVHGQFDHLFSKDTHRNALNHFGGTLELAQRVKEAWEDWKEAKTKLADAQQSLEQNQYRREELAADLQELKALHILDDEETLLMERRAFLMGYQKIYQAMAETQQALGEGTTPEDQLLKASRSIVKIVDQHKNAQKIYEALLQALEPLQEAIALVDQEINNLEDSKNENVEDIEIRLFDLRRLAKKHMCEVNELLDVQEKLETQLASLDGGTDHLKDLKIQEEQAMKTYVDNAEKMHQIWEKAAKNFESRMHQELQSLCLDKVQFQVRLEKLPLEKWGPQGMYSVEFYIATNLNQPLMPLKQVASGGELSRIMLALKSITAAELETPVLIFDEIDSGMGGAVAAAVGSHLRQLSKSFQVLAITHAPQVASYANHHFKVMKDHGENETLTTITTLTRDAREEEIARMLSGAVISDSARKAARELLILSSCIDK